MLKKVGCALVALMLLFLTAFASGEEAPASGPVYGWNFDLRLHLNPEAFSPESRERVQGYAQAVDQLRLKGNWAYDSGTRILDLHLDIIPVTNEASAISLRVYGYLSHLVLASPLLGEETLVFNNQALMEFCLKAYHHLGIRLPYIALLFPYVTEHAFSQAVLAWEKKIGRYIGRAADFDTSRVVSLGRAWGRLLQDDPFLREWFEAISLESDLSEVLDAELAAVPHYLKHRLAGDRGIHVDVEKDRIRWSNESGVFLDSSFTENRESILLSLPRTENGFDPSLHWIKEKNDGHETLSFDLSYASHPEAGEGDPVNLVEIHASADLPAVWPSDSGLSAAVKIDGRLLPPLDLRLQGHTSASGDLTLSLHGGAAPSGEEALLTVSGLFSPYQPAQAPWIDWDWMMAHSVNILSINDVTLRELITHVARPVFQGLLRFLVEVPASACQSLMDDLEDMGLLGLLLGS